MKALQTYFIGFINIDSHIVYVSYYLAIPSAAWRYSVFKLSSPQLRTFVWHGRDLNSPQKRNCELLRALQFIFWTCLLCSNSLLTICRGNVHNMWNVEKRTSPSTGILKLLRLWLSVPFTRTNDSSGRLGSTLQNSCIYTIAIFWHVYYTNNERILMKM